MSKPTATYEIDAEEAAFIQALHSFKARTGRAFPTFRELLGILRSLGYTRASPAALVSGHGGDAHA